MHTTKNQLQALKKYNLFSQVNALIFLNFVFFFSTWLHIFSLPFSLTPALTKISVDAMFTIEPTITLIYYYC